MCEYIIKMNLKQVELDGVNWIQMFLDVKNRRQFLRG